MKRDVSDRKSVTILADLLREIIPEEISRIKDFEIPHMGTLGNAYEGLTEYVSELICDEVSQSVRIVTGQISSQGKVIRRQVDRMIVFGEGREIGVRSKQYEYDISQVIVIIESKKTLNKASLIDGINHCSTFKEELLFNTGVSNSPQDYHDNNFILKKVFSISFIRGLGLYADKFLRYMSQCLVIDKHSPVTIVFGAGGFLTAEGLAKAFADSVWEHKIESSSFWTLPNLIVCNNNALCRSGTYPFILANQANGDFYVGLMEGKGIELMILTIWKKLNSMGLCTKPYKYSKEIPYNMSTTLAYGLNLPFLKSYEQGDYLSKITRYTDAVVPKAGYLGGMWKPLRYSMEFKSFMINYISSFNGDFNLAVDRLYASCTEKIAGRLLKELLASSPELEDSSYIYRLDEGAYLFCGKKKNYVFYSTEIELLKGWLSHTKMTGDIVFIAKMVSHTGSASHHIFMPPMVCSVVDGKFDLSSGVVYRD